MEWTDEAIVLSARPHGEAAAVVQLLTTAHGRHAGLVRGGMSSRLRPLLQPGNCVRARWAARLSEHLGSYTLELATAHAGAVLGDPERLAILSSACAVAEAALPEREPHPRIFEGLTALLAALPGSAAGEAYVGWEIGLLAELGFGLDLSACAVTGANDGLAYVSPRTGRAVSLAAGAPYQDRLLPLPGFLLGLGSGGPDAFAAGLRLTGHFLERHVFASLHRALPAARQRLAERSQRAAEPSVPVV